MTWSFRIKFAQTNPQVQFFTMWQSCPRIPPKRMNMVLWWNILKKKAIEFEGKTEPACLVFFFDFPAFGHKTAGISIPSWDIPSQPILLSWWFSDIPKVGYGLVPIGGYFSKSQLCTFKTSKLSASFLTPPKFNKSPLKTYWLRPGI